MEPGHEVETPATDESTPLPIRVDSIGEAVKSSPATPAASAPGTSAHTPPIPTAETLLRAIAAVDGPWYPSRYAADAGVPRDSLDEPLAELRVAALVRVAEWVRGVGQGYVLTPEGQAAAANPAELERLKQPAQPESPAALVIPAPVLIAKPEAVDGITPDAEPEAFDAPPDTELPIRPPLVVPVLLMANALWFFVCAVVGIRWGLTPSRSLSEGHPDVLHRFGAVSGPDLLNGEWWRLLTSCFVHIGVLHLIGNLFALAMMGPLAELLWGRGRLLVIYFISGLAGSALAMTLRPDSILAGASGAIWGIQMSLFAWLFAFRRHLPPDLASDWFRRLGVVFVLNAGISFLPGVSWEGHLGGGVAGFLAAGLLNAARFGDQRRRASAWALLALLPVLSIGILVAAMDAKGMPGWQHLRQRIVSEHEAEERAERRKKLREAEIEINTHVAPRLAQLAPQAVEQPEAELRELLKIANRTPEQVNPARSKSSAMLLGMLASPEPPKVAAWEAWHASRREADRLWDAFKPK